MRVPNARALDALARALDEAEPGAELVADLATGVGKTYIAGGLLDYLYETGVRNVVIVTPGSTIQRKTIDNLTPGNPKYLRGLQCNPLVITLNDLDRGIVGDALTDESRLKVFVFTVQSLLRPDTKENRRAYKENEQVGPSIVDHLRSCDDLVVIADEHHVYFSGTARKFRAAIQDLNPRVLIGLTATPHESTPRESIVYHYPLADAIADGYVKVPVLVARQDGVSDQRTQLADGVALLNAKRDAMHAYCDRTHSPYVEPVMFVVANTIDEASRIRDMLAGPDMLGGDTKVLLVTSEEPDETLRLLDGIESPGSTIRAVVSVSMLKEGWDVRSIYVIASVRALESQLLTEQVLGRGLRLPFGHRTGVPMLDSVDVLSHHAFGQLLAEAEVLLTQTLGQRAAEAAVEAVATPGIATPPTSLDRADDAVREWSAHEVMVNLPGLGAADAAPNQPSLFDGDDEDLDGATHQVGGISTIEARLANAIATTATLTQPLVARPVNGIRVPLFLPRVTTKWVRDPFTLASLSPAAVEALGQRFANDNAPSLILKALDAERIDGVVHVRIEDRHEHVEATQLRMPFDTIESDLVHRLLASNDVQATVAELNAATGVARAFLAGAGVTPETPWRAEHGQLATEALVNYIRTKQTSSPAREVAEVEQVRWPDPLELTLTQPATSRHLVTGRPQFQRGYPYSGWTRSVYDTATFDAYSTEFRLAVLFDNTDGIRAWVRIVESVPLQLPYLRGAVQHFYRPDFLVIDDAGTHWLVEGKADGDMTDPVVIAKRDAARAWVQTVNASDDVPARWGYLLASEVAIAAASSWAALRAASQTLD